MSLKFEYNVFYKFFSDPSNFYWNNVPIKANFYKPAGKDSEWLSGSFFIVGDTDVYVTVKDNDILFTILKTDSHNAYWADHFHSGTTIMTNVHRKVRNVDTVFFHFSSQNLHDQRKDMVHKCNFRDHYENLHDIGSILCTNRKTNMQSAFPPNLFQVVESILKMPFLPHSTSGGGKRITPTKNKAIIKGIKHTIYNGQRGGLHIFKAGKLKRYM
jgi:hypothetical protein